MYVFGAGTLIAKLNLDANGSTVATPTPVRLGAMQDVQGDIKFETKKLYGAQQFPLAVGRGKGSLDFKAKVADINASVLGNLLFGTSASTGSRQALIDSPQSVPASTPFTLTIAPPSSGTFVQDLGVVKTSTGASMTRVATPSAAGQYSVNESTGVYTFYSSDASAAVLVSYEYTTTTGQVFTMTNQLMGLAPFFGVVLQEQYQGHVLTLKLNQCTSSQLSLPFKNEDFAISDFSFEAMADSAGIVGYISLT